MTFWEDIELKLPEFKTIEERRKLGKKIKITATLIFVLALSKNIACKIKLNLF